MQPPHQQQQRRQKKMKKLEVDKKKPRRMQKTMNAAHAGKESRAKKQGEEIPSE